MSDSSYVRSVKRDTIDNRSRLSTFVELWSRLAADWSCPLADAKPTIAPADRRLGAGQHVRFLNGARDDNLEAFVAAYLPGGPTPLGNLRNQEITGILYTLYRTWRHLRTSDRSPLYLCAERFDDRLQRRLEDLSALVPRLSLIQLCNVRHRNKYKLAELAALTEQTGESRFAQRIIHDMQEGVRFTELSLTPLDIEVPAGVARSRSEQFDVLAVDQSGRLVVIELKAAAQKISRSLQHSVFQSLRYWDWAHRNRRALQILYGRELIRDVHARPLLLIINEGSGFPDDVLDVQRAAPTEGAEPLMRMFHVPETGARPVEERPTWRPPAEEL